MNYLKSASIVLIVLGVFFPCYGNDSKNPNQVQIQNQFQEEVRKSNRKFIDCYKQLLRVKTSVNYGNVNAIEKNLRLEKKLMFKYWIAEKLVQLKKKK